jgi:O-acetyl-ADP-ribose deacetylase (regulator of RNase III)
VEKLRSCYRESLKLAVGNGLESIAFPFVSTGVYGYPKEKAARIAVDEVSGFLRETRQITQVVFCVFDDENYWIYEELLAAR